MVEKKLPGRRHPKGSSGKEEAEEEGEEDGFPGAKPAGVGRASQTELGSECHARGLGFLPEDTGNHKGSQAGEKQDRSQVYNSPAHSLVRRGDCRAKT